MQSHQRDLWPGLAVFAFVLAATAIVIMFFDSAVFGPSGLTQVMIDAFFVCASIFLIAFGITILGYLRDQSELLKIQYFSSAKAVKEEEILKLLDRMVEDAALVSIRYVLDQSQSRYRVYFSQDFMSLIQERAKENHQGLVSSEKDLRWFVQLQAEDF